MFGDLNYTSYFKLHTLANKLGYEKPRNLFMDGKPLHSHKKYYLNDLKQELKGPHYGASIIPDHLDSSTDKNRNTCIYIDAIACKDLISAAMKQSKFKVRAEEFNNVFNCLADISNAIITKLNQLVSEYRYQQQTQQLALLETNRKEQTQKLIAIEQDKQRLAEQQKQLEKETKLLALKTYPDVELEMTHYGYIFSSPEYITSNLYKIGITDNLVNRERDSKTYCPSGQFLHTTKTYDSRSTELTLHQTLKRYGLHYKISSGNEWFKLPNLEEAIHLLDLAANSTNGLYERVATYPSLLRNTFTLEAKPSILTIKDDPSIDTIIASYVNDVVKHLIDNKVTCMSKTNMILLLRKKASDPKYKKKKASYLIRILKALHWLRNPLRALCVLR